MRIGLAVALAVAAAACSRDEPKPRPRPAPAAVAPPPNSVRLPPLRYRPGDVVVMSRDQRTEVMSGGVPVQRELLRSAADRVIIVVDDHRGPTRTIVTYHKLEKEITNEGDGPWPIRVPTGVMFVVERTGNHLEIDGPPDGSRLDPASDHDASVIRSDFTEILPADDFSAVLAAKTFAPDVPVQLTAADLDRVNAIRGTHSSRVIAVRFTLAASTAETATLDYEARITLNSSPSLQLDATGTAVIDRHTGAWNENHGRGTLAAAAADDMSGTFEVSTTAALSNPTNPRK